MSGFDKDRFMAGVPAKDRNGDVAIFKEYDDGSTFPIVALNGDIFTDNGRFLDYGESQYDLIKMVEQEQSPETEQPQSEQLTFRDRVFLAALSGVIACGDIEYISGEVATAWQYADEAVKQRGEQK